MTEDRLSQSLWQTARSAGADVVLHDVQQTWDGRRLCDFWDELSQMAGPPCRVGLVARNQVEHVAVLGGAMALGFDVVMLHAAQSPASLAHQLDRLQLDLLCAAAVDCSAEVLSSARASGIGVLAIDDGLRLLLHPGHARRPCLNPGGVTLLTSGTTGLPKHVPLSRAALIGMVDNSAASYAGNTCSAAPVVMVHPLSTVGGLAYVLSGMAQGQALVLLDRFKAREWADAVRLHGPVRAAIPPAGVRMLLEEAVNPADLASLRLVAVGGGALAPSLHDAFEAHFGIPLLIAYGATEFGGVVASWTLDEYIAFGKDKRGSAGRASGGAQIRVVDEGSGTLLPPGQAGLLEVQTDRIGPSWIATNDQATIDADGYLFLHGRADGAINRGGFKIVPEQLAASISEHPAVVEAAVVGMSDTRLGAVPVAAVELLQGSTLTEAELLKWLRNRLLAYQIPAAVRIVANLPRNDSMKVALGDVRQMFINLAPDAAAGQTPGHGPAEKV